jgi:hypothetical protein
VRPAEKTLIENSADDLITAADAIDKASAALRATSKGLPDDPGELRATAATVQAEAHRLALATLTTRAVAERLATVSTLATPASDGKEG